MRTITARAGDIRRNYFKYCHFGVLCLATLYNLKNTLNSKYHKRRTEVPRVLLEDAD
jgi:hypothetical protein